jgi:hypothetical protein
METLQEYDVKSKHELKDHEKAWIIKLDTINNGLNTNLPNVTQAESLKRYRESDKGKAVIKKNYDNKKIVCTCGRLIHRRQGYENHMKSKIHNRLMTDGRLTIDDPDYHKNYRERQRSLKAFLNSLCPQ